MVLVLAFYTKDPDGVGNYLNVILFPVIYPSTGYTEYLLTRIWDTFLGYNTFKSFWDMGSLLGLQNIALVTIWDTASKQLYEWKVFCEILQGNSRDHPATQEMQDLIDDKKLVRACLCVQAHHQTSFPDALLCLVQSDLNGRF